MNVKHFKYTFQKCSDKWITRNGKILELKDMNKRHLINSMNMIERICFHENWNCMDFIIYQNLLKEINNRNIITLKLTQEEYESIPILISMAKIYFWELYQKNANDIYWKQHKENINLINQYHKKGYQGIMAVANKILEKINKRR